MSRQSGLIGQDIVLVHGWDHNSAIWNPVVRRLRTTARVLTVDLRGHGYSGWDAPATATDLVRDIQLAAETGNVRSPIVVGHSWGAELAVRYAQLNPTTRAVICVDKEFGDPGTRHEPSAKDCISAALETHALTEPVSQDELEEAIDVLHYRGTARAELFRGRFPALHPDGGMRMPRAEWQQQLQARRTEEPVDSSDLLKLDCPVRLIYADGYRSPEAIQRLEVQGSQLTKKNDISLQWVRGSHEVPLEHPGRICDSIREFTNPCTARATDAIGRGEPVLALDGGLI